MTERLNGRVCIVTGATSGVGRATALRFAREGGKVVAAARRGAELELVASAAARDGRGQILAFPTDVTREKDIQALVDFTLAKCGQLDVAVNAAGATFAGALTHELEESAFRDWIDGYLVSSFLCTKHELRGMLAGDSAGDRSIVNVGTFVGHSRTLPGTSGYAAAKTGLIGLTRTVAAEYAERKIRSNLLIMGGADTAMFRLWNDTPEKHDAAAQFHALKRIAKPEEVANSALFLASSESSFVTGSLFTADGGVSLL